MVIARALLIVTAAGLATIPAAQAADMPVKAKPIEYVKVCSLYGSGFYYIPGTDTCLKVGGYVRVQAETNAGAGGVVTGSGGTMAPQGRFDLEDTNDINSRVRAAMSLDARTQTEFGTLRSYIRAAWDQTTPAVSGAGTTPCGVAAANTCLGWWDRAFIQFAGFTVGRAQSFFDMYSASGIYTYSKPRTTGDTNLDGQNLWAYTVQFGNGVSYTLSLEEPAEHNKFGTSDNTVAGFFTFPVATSANSADAIEGASNNGFRVPDVVTNLRIDQAWGYLGVSTAIHDVSGGYYKTGLGVNAGHPATTYGWAFSVSGMLNLAGGDTAGINFVWSKGAPGYAFQSGNWQLYNNSNSAGVAWAADAVFGSGTTVELIKAWSINAGY
jgi:porin-like protein